MTKSLGIKAQKKTGASQPLRIISIHRFAGLFAGLFILIMSLSGAILVFHNDLLKAGYPKIIDAGNKPLLTIDSCYKSLQQHYPAAEIIYAEIAGSTKQPFRFRLYDPAYKKGKRVLEVLVHPQTATVLRASGPDTYFLSWLAALHSSFHLGKVGEWLLGFFGLIFLLSILTGIVLFRRSIGAVLTFRKSIYKKKNLHQVIGTWALLFNLLIAGTGTWMQRYVFKKGFYSNTSYTPVLHQSPSLYYSLDSAISIIRKPYPVFNPAIVYFSLKPKGNATIYGSQSTNSFIHSKQYADVLMLDSTGKITYTAFVNEIAPADRYDIVNAQLHYGQYGGWLVKLIYSILGLTGGALSLTGFLLWWRRKN